MILAPSGDMTTTSNAPTDWRAHLVESAVGIARIIAATKRIAVLGIKIRESGEAAYYVPAYAQRAGIEVVPVPVYYPEVTEILGQAVYRTVSAIPDAVDMVNVFRPAPKIDAHLEDIIAKRPASVWFQLGIRNDAAAERLARAGIDVVQDRCLLVELQSLGR